MDININALPTPCYIVDERLLIKNLEKLKSVSDRTGCHILLAQKGFSMYDTYPLIGTYLQGTTASSLFEAKLGSEEMGGEVHIYSPAYKEEEINEIIELCDHIVFNSSAQYQKYKDRIQASKKQIQCGLRINPEYAEIETDLYNPCFENSRLGITLANLTEEDFEGIDGLHFHTMCEQNSDVLKRTIQVVDEKFGTYLEKVKWVNFGGGHHITRADYDIETLIECIEFIQKKYNVLVYLEPGEAVALNTGYLVTQVLDTIVNTIEIAIVDTSAACHMPDVLEMPYRPEIIGAKKPGEYPFTYRLGAPTCLAGDVIGDYSFEKALSIGDRLVFCDMAHYTMVKNNTFNGMNLPAIAIFREVEGIRVLRQFGYQDFKGRLGC